MYYKDLGFQYTPEMMALTGWYMALHPEVLLDNAPMKDFITNRMGYTFSAPTGTVGRGIRGSVIC